jgi:hypothetical protein
MAVVKEITGKLLIADRDNGTTSSGQIALPEVSIINDNNTVLIENESQQTLYLNNEAHDSVTLTPYFDKKATGIKRNAKNVFNQFSNNMLLTSKPQCRTNWNDDTYTASTYWDNCSLDAIKYSNETFHKNLTSEAYDFNPNFYKFTANNQEYTLLLSYAFEDIGNVAQAIENTTHFTIIKGDDYSNPIATLELDYSNNGLYPDNIHYSTKLPLYFEILTIDTTNLSSCFAVLHFTAYREYQYEYIKGQGLITLNFDLNTFAWKSSPINLIFPNPVFPANQDSILADLDLQTAPPSKTNKLSHNLFYCGKDTSSNHIFMDINLDHDYASDGGAIADGEISFTLYELDEVNMILDATTRFVASDNNIANVKTITDNYVNGDLINIYCSKFQALDSNKSNTMYSYIAAFDNSGNFKPIRIIWNKNIVISNYAGTGTAPLYVDECTVTFPNSNPSTNYIKNWASNYADAADTLDSVASSNYRSLPNIPLFMKSLSLLSPTDNTINFTYLFKKNELANHFHAADALHSDLTSFSIDVSDFATNSDLNLTYQSSYTLKALDLIYNSAVNKIKAITPTGIKMLSYSANAWVLSSEHTGIYNVLAEDSYGRNWALNMPVADLSSLSDSALQYIYLNVKNVDMKLELLSDTLPHVTSLSLETPNQTYAGSDLNNRLIVNAYDETNVRIAKDVRLTIEGNNCTFDADFAQGITAGATTAVVTTSTSADTFVDITITNSGLINVSASFDL